MKDAVSYLLSNCFFTIALNIFCQTIVIPMGSAPAPFLANPFLYFYESNWMNYLKRNDLIRGGSKTAATSKMECFVIIVNGFQPLTIITKRSILDVAAVLDPPLLIRARKLCSLFRFVMTLM